METYQESLLDILTREDQYIYGARTDSARLAVTSGEFRYDLSEGYPLVTTKKTDFDNIAHELIWFMRGETNIKYLVDNDVHIWDDNAFDQFVKSKGIDVEQYSDEWQEMKEEFVARIRDDESFAAEHGDLGPVYGKMWRAYPGDDGPVDQLGKNMEGLRQGKESTRYLVNAWHPDLVEKVALPPCHTMYQLHKRDDKLDITLSPQRSTDAFLGEPYNVASYSLLTEILADDAGLKPGMFFHHHGNHHLYCGAGERGEWYNDEDNRSWLRDAVRSAKQSGDQKAFKQVRKDLESRLPDEEDGKERLDHVPLAVEQLSREPYDRPTVYVDGNKPFDEVKRDDLRMEGYDHHPGLYGRMAV